MQLIGITGFKRSGKDTVAQLVIERTEEFTRAAFADTLKSMAYAVDPYVETFWPGDGESFQMLERLSYVVDRDGWERAKEFDDVRRFLQRLGTEGVRNHIGENAWVDALFRSLDPEGAYVIPDVRFPNEADAIHKRGGQLWRVERPGCVSDGHPSEEFIPTLPADRVIDNSSSLSHLETRVLAALYPPNHDAARAADNGYPL